MDDVVSGGDDAYDDEVEHVVNGANDAAYHNHHKKS